jgi:hypothetical protein
MKQVFAFTTAFVAALFFVGFWSGPHAQISGGGNVYQSQGTFTLTLTNCVSGGTGTGKYWKTGKIVTVQIPSMTCTSNGSPTNLSGYPNNILPSTANQLLIAQCEDNTIQNQLCMVTIGQGSAIMSVCTAATQMNCSNTMTASGTKGITNIQNVTYALN